MRCSDDVGNEGPHGRLGKMEGMQKERQREPQQHQSVGVQPLFFRKDGLRIREIGVKLHATCHTYAHDNKLNIEQMATKYNVAFSKYYGNQTNGNTN
jgi:hypothetical protein